MLPDDDELMADTIAIPSHPEYQCTANPDLLTKNSNKNQCNSNKSRRNDFFGFIHANERAIKIKNNIITKQEKTIKPVRINDKMSYEKQLEIGISKNDMQMCAHIIGLNSVDLNKQISRKLPLGIACEYNCYNIVELLIKVSVFHRVFF